MDIPGFISSLTVADVVLFALFGLAFLFGFHQGLIRQLLGLGVMVVAFVLAANFREPVGNWLAGYWTTLPPAFAQMAAFAASFLVLFVLGNAIVQIAYKRIPILSHIALVDEVAGGLLALIVSVVAVALLVFALDSYFLVAGNPPGGDVKWLRDLHGALDNAALVHAMRQAIIPGLVTIMGPLVPEAVRQFAP